MAQNITLLGASYSDVPAVLLPKTGGGTARFDDATVTTATAADVASGKIFLASNGTITTGAASGGGSSWTLVASTSYTVSTTSTSRTTVATFATGYDSLLNLDERICVIIKDTAGPRAGYFYGGMFFCLPSPGNFASGYSTSSFSVGMIYRRATNGWNTRYVYGTTGYGVFPDTYYNNGDINISSRYNSSYSTTINGTYSVKVYLLAPPITLFT